MAPRTYKRRGKPGRRRKMSPKMIKLSRKKVFRKKFPYGSRRRRGGTTIVVKARSLSNNVWIGNPVGTDIINALPTPWFNGTNIEDRIVYITNAVDPNQIVNVFASNNMDQYKAMFKFMTVTSMWYKYTPAITQGIVSGPLGENYGSVAGTITVMPTNDPAQDLIDYPRSSKGLHDLKMNTRSTTFSIYKKHFGRFVPKIKYDAADGGQQLTKFSPYRIDLDGDQALYSGVLIMMQVPSEAGVEVNSLTPSFVGNWPSEGYTSVIGKWEMGGTCVFSGLRV